MALADYKVTSTEQTVESQVAAARDERDRVALWSRILPISFAAAGLVALIGGAAARPVQPAARIRGGRSG